jgi:hypothetical protein
MKIRAEAFLEMLESRVSTGTKRSAADKVVLPT